MATFSIDPERVEYGHVRTVLADDPASGFVSTRQANTAVSDDTEKAEQQFWVLSWEYASRSDWSTIDGYWDTTKGGAAAMTWTPPGGSALSVRMTDFRTQSNAETNGYRMTVTLEEIV